MLDTRGRADHRLDRPPPSRPTFPLHLPLIGPHLEMRRAAAVVRPIGGTRRRPRARAGGVRRRHRARCAPAHARPSRPWTSRAHSSHRSWALRRTSSSGILQLSSVIVISPVIIVSARESGRFSVLFRSRASTPRLGSTRLRKGAGAAGGIRVVVGRERLDQLASGLVCLVAHSGGSHSQGRRRDR